MNYVTPSSFYSFRRIDEMDIGNLRSHFHTSRCISDGSSLNECHESFSICQKAFATAGRLGFFLPAMSV